MRTRKRCYGEEVSQSSSNIAYVDRSRLKQFDQQEGKRQKQQKKSKERSFFTFDMSGRNIELINLLGTHNATYVNLLEQVCNGQDQTMGTVMNGLFWIKFADKLCQKSRGLEKKEGMALACQHYCDDLRVTYNQYRKEGGPHIHGPSPAYWGQLTRIFGGRTPSTSTGRSSRSTGSISSTRSGSVKKLDLLGALAQLTFSGVMSFDDIEIVKNYVTKSKSSEHVFMSGTHEWRANVVRKFLGKELKNYSKETEIPNSV